MKAYQRQFIQLAIDYQALCFGDFTLKSGRVSPYFFNAGLFRSGAALAAVGRCYAAAVEQAQIPFDVLFGPAYKGIPLVTATAVALSDSGGAEAPLAFNRKEAKAHGEGGVLVGTPLQGKVLIVDDVITAGTAVREVMAMIQAAGAEPAGVLIGLDRRERGQGKLSAVQEVEQEYGIPVISIVDIRQVIDYMRAEADLAEWVEKVEAYRCNYGI